MAGVCPRPSPPPGAQINRPLITRQKQLTCRNSALLRCSFMQLISRLSQLASVFAPLKAGIPTALIKAGEDCKGLQWLSRGPPRVDRRALIGVAERQTAE